MRVSFDVPDKVWASLALKADGRGVKVADLLVEAVVSAAAPRHKARVLPLTDEVRCAEMRSLHELHWSATEISRRLGYKLETVLATLADMGLIKGKVK